MHPERYSRHSSFKALVKMTMLQRSVVARERLYGLASIYPSGEPVPPVSLFSMNYFQMPTLRIVLLISLFLHGSSKELQTTLSLKQAGAHKKRVPESQVQQDKRSLYYAE
jgi:hypothetical protein